MTLLLDYRGTIRHLRKHPAIEAALRNGTITEDKARFTPWYLRLTTGGKRGNFKLCATDKDALRMARDLISGRDDKPLDFASFLEARAARRGITIGTLAQEWFAAGLPFTSTKARTAPAVEQLRSVLDRALPWWSTKPVAGITARTMSEYVVWRRSNIRRGTGDRSADIQLAALSSLCQWAQFDGRIAANPFSKRPRFQDSAAVRHCHEAMPETDEILHRLLTWFFTRTADVPSAALQHSPDTRRITAGAWLAFTALTGLRPQEPQELWLLPNMTQTPDSLKSLQPGQCFPTRDGQMRMKVVRYKRGQNPFVILTPAALDFLRVWTEWLVGVRHTSYSMPTKRLFPNVDDPTRPFCAGSDTSPLNKLLNDACRACAVPPCRPKGLGRAFYVRDPRAPTTPRLPASWARPPTAN
jgi:hypothetical protein